MVVNANLEIDLLILYSFTLFDIESRWNYNYTVLR